MLSLDVSRQSGDVEGEGYITSLFHEFSHVVTRFHMTTFLCFAMLANRVAFSIWLLLIKRDFGQGPLSVHFLPTLVLLQHKKSEGAIPKLRPTLGTIIPQTWAQ